MKQREDLADDFIVTRNEGLLTAEVDGELMAMSVESGTCYGLNEPGTRIWALLAAPRTIGELCAQLQSEYEVDAGQCRSDVIGLIEELRSEGLVTVRGR